MIADIIKKSNLGTFAEKPEVDLTPVFIPWALKHKKQFLAKRDPKYYALLKRAAIASKNWKDSDLPLDMKIASEEIYPPFDELLLGPENDKVKTSLGKEYYNI
tara:strand:+ start:88 stop:396 length:309 start_codon:yes stop_codon:yes gene_type:complete